MIRLGLVVATLAIAACAPAPARKEAPPAPPPVLTPATPALAVLVVHAPFPSFLMTATDDAGED